MQCIMPTPGYLTLPGVVVGGGGGGGQVGMGHFRGRRMDRVTMDTGKCGS